MALGDILWASGYDSRDPAIFDLQTPSSGMFDGAAPLRTPQSTYKIHNPNVNAIASLSQSGIKEFVVATGFYRTASGQLDDLIRLRSPNGTDNVTLGLNGGDKLIVKRGSTTLATGSGTTPFQSWVWVWMYVLIHDTTGKCRVKLNNVVDIAITTGLDTRNDAGTNGDTADRIVAIPVGNGQLDDTIILDATGTASDGDDVLANEITIPYLFPDSAGDTTQLTPSTGSNWQNVDENPPNDDTDYNSHATNGNLDLYNCAALPGGATAIDGVVIRARVKKTDAGAKSTRLLVKTGGTVSNGADIALPTSYGSFQRPLRKNPVTAVDWTTTELNAIQPGIEVRA